MAHTSKHRGQGRQRPIRRIVGIVTIVVLLLGILAMVFQLLNQRRLTEELSRQMQEVKKIYQEKGERGNSNLGHR